MYRPITDEIYRDFSHRILMRNMIESPTENSQYSAEKRPTLPVRTACYVAP
ncbi:unnamed protein product, partial [Didymodactylos carnosus]